MIVVKFGTMNGRRLSKLLTRPHRTEIWKKYAWERIDFKIASGEELALTTESAFGKIFGLERDGLEIRFPISMQSHDTRISQFLSHSEITGEKGITCGSYEKPQ